MIYMNREERPPRPAGGEGLVTLMDKVRTMATNQALVTDGFARAFIDATGLDPRDCEMVIEQRYEGEAMRQVIWFRPRGSEVTLPLPPTPPGCKCRQHFVAVSGADKTARVEIRHEAHCPHA